MMIQRICLLLSMTFVFSGWLVGCGAGDKEGTLFTPSLGTGGKADDTSGIDIVGSLGFCEGGVLGEFYKDNQFDGYLFSALRKSKITIDNTNKGTSRSLDSTLFLFGPADGNVFPADYIAMDDDSGWGPHARITDFTIPETGDYLFVIGAYSTTYRGRYRIDLVCRSGSCTPEPNEIDPCDDGNPCTDDTHDAAEGCVHENNTAACNDGDPCSFDDVCSQGVCAGQLLDLDGDGFSPASCGGPDCNDVDASIYPGARFICDDGIDQNCDGEDEVCVIGFEISNESFSVSEAQDKDSFTFQLTSPPIAEVEILVSSSDPSEGVVYPIQLYFDNSNWDLPQEVLVIGVNDDEEDGDIDFQVLMQMNSADEDYDGLELPTLAAVNRNTDVQPDYSDLDGLENEALIDALYRKVVGHKVLLYSGDSSARDIMFSVIDLHDDKVECLYSGVEIDLPKCAIDAYRDGMNTEHSWPQSHFDKLEPMKSDLNHLFPTVIGINGTRSSYDFGETSNPGSPNSILGQSALGSQTIFQVRPERRGDVARAHFYMAVRYSLDPYAADFDDDGNPANGSINDDEESVLRKWHNDDPVDDRERLRNHMIEAYQGKRNPFIDRPDLVDLIVDF
jgi:endonuclease I